jgi:hypothetical protein
MDCIHVNDNLNEVQRAQLMPMLLAVAHPVAENLQQLLASDTRGSMWNSIATQVAASPQTFMCAVRSRNGRYIWKLLSLGAPSPTSCQASPSRLLCIYMCGQNCMARYLPNITCHEHAI